MDGAALAALGTTLTGAAGVLYAIYKLRGQNAGTVVTDQHDLINDMKVLHDEMQEALAECQRERERLRHDR